MTNSPAPDKAGYNNTLAILRVTWNYYQHQPIFLTKNTMLLIRNIRKSVKRFTNIQLLLINTSKYFYFYKYFLLIFVPMSKEVTESAKAKKPVKKVKATKKTPKEKVKKESLFQPKYQFEKLDEVDKSLFYTGVSCQSLGTNFKQWAKRKTNPVWKARCFTAVMGKETGVKIIMTS